MLWMLCQIMYFMFDPLAQVGKCNGRWRLGASMGFLWKWSKNRSHKQSAPQHCLEHQTQSHRRRLWGLRLHRSRREFPNVEVSKDCFFIFFSWYFHLSSYDLTQREDGKQTLPRCSFLQHVLNNNFTRNGSKFEWGPATPTHPKLFSNMLRHCVGRINSCVKPNNSLPTKGRLLLWGMMLIFVFTNLREFCMAKIMYWFGHIYSKHVLAISLSRGSSNLRAAAGACFANLAGLTGKGEISQCWDVADCNVMPSKIISYAGRSCGWFSRQSIGRKSRTRPRMNIRCEVFDVEIRNNMTCCKEGDSVCSSNGFACG